MRKRERIENEEEREGEPDRSCIPGIHINQAIIVRISSDHILQLEVT